VSRGDRGRWWRFALLAAVTALVLVPVAVPVLVAAQRSAASGGLLPALLGVAANPEAATWFRNTFAVAGATVLAAIALGTPAGYVLARVAGRAVDGFALLVFAMQALPTVVLLVPLFVLLAPLGLVDSLPGLVLVLIGMTVAVATWTMTTAVAAVPVSLEEAAWLDGCSVLGGVVRVVLPNVAPGLLTTAVVTFLFVWNEYLVALVLLPGQSNWTVGIGVVTGRIPVFAVAAMLPPLVVFAALHRFFRFGGVAGALADR